MEEPDLTPEQMQKIIDDAQKELTSDTIKSHLFIWIALMIFAIFGLIIAFS